MGPGQTVVMVTTSYPRFPGDSIATFMEPIARGVAARGHEVHVVAPWHPSLRRAPEEDGLRFHFFRYAPVSALNVFGYAGALRADIRLRGSAYAAAPFALAAGWLAARSVARRVGATIMHGHWVIPGGTIALAAGGGRPLVLSLHGSDIYVAETLALARSVARRTLKRADWITACSRDLASRAVRLGAAADRIDVVPYGVDADRFRPDPSERRRRRAALDVPDDLALLFTAGRLVRKKGFEYLIAAVARLVGASTGVRLLVAGAGDLEPSLRTQAAELGVEAAVQFMGAIDQGEVASCLSAADLAIVPSVRDDAGNVDGLPNIVMEALASGTALITTPAGGIGAIVTDGETARLVPERDAGALAATIADLLAHPEERARLGAAARAFVQAEHSWTRVADHYDNVYRRLARTASLPHK